MEIAHNLKDYGRNAEFYNESRASPCTPVQMRELVQLDRQLTENFINFCWHYVYSNNSASTEGLIFIGYMSLTKGLFCMRYINTWTQISMLFPLFDLFLVCSQRNIIATYAYLSVGILFYNKVFGFYVLYLERT